VVWLAGVMAATKGIVSHGLQAKSSAAMGDGGAAGRDALGALSRGGGHKAE